MVNSEKCLILFAGVNGVGKSTLYNLYPTLANMPRVNVDEIARKYGRWDDVSVLMKAGKEAVMLQKQLFAEGKSFNQETTLCGKAVLSMIKKAKTSGYRVEIYYVGIDDVEICKKRISKRVSEGGHGIPDIDVERRYDESLRNMGDILVLCDFVVFFDNTEEFRMFAAYDNGLLIRYEEDTPKWFDAIDKRMP